LGAASKYLGVTQKYCKDGPEDLPEGAMSLGAARRAFPEATFSLEAGSGGNDAARSPVFEVRSNRTIARLAGGTWPGLPLLLWVGLYLGRMMEKMRVPRRAGPAAALLKLLRSVRVDDEGRTSLEIRLDFHSQLSLHVRVEESAASRAARGASKATEVR